jgi:hypothetical protein
MKRFIFVAILVTLSAVISAQGLFTKVTAKDFKASLKGDSIVVVPVVNKFRLVYGVTGTSIDLKTGEIGFLSSTGVGVGYVNYKLDDLGKPYATWGVSGMVLIANEENLPLYETDGKVATGILLSGSLGPVSLGPSYYPSVKKLLLNFGLQFKF